MWLGNRVQPAVGSALFLPHTTAVKPCGVGCTDTAPSQEPTSLAASVSGLFYLAQHLPVQACHRMEVSHFAYPLICGQTLELLFHGVILNKAAMNMGIHISLSS